MAHHHMNTSSIKTPNGWVSTAGDGKLMLDPDSRRVFGAWDFLSTSQAQLLKDLGLTDEEIAQSTIVCYEYGKETGTYPVIERKELRSQMEPKLMEEAPVTPPRRSHKRDYAKELVMENMAKYVKDAITYFPGKNERIEIYHIDELQMVVAMRKTRDGNVFWGHSICNPADVYNKTVGRYIAIKRCRRAKFPKTVLPYI